MGSKHFYFMTITLLLCVYFDILLGGKDTDNGNQEHIIAKWEKLQKSLSESLYCPFVQGCVNIRHYGSAIDLTQTKYDEKYNACCRPCNCGKSCEMECCSDYIPCSDLFANDYQETVCISTTFPGRYIHPGILAIATCKEGSEDEERKKCIQKYDLAGQTIQDIIPVIDITNEYTYRNIHCALCNGVNKTRLEFFKLNLFCGWTSNVDFADKSKILQTVLDNYLCDFTFGKPSPAMSVKPCSFVIDKCNVTGLWKGTDPFDPFASSKKLCLEADGSRYELINSMMFKGVCGACNGMTISGTPKYIDTLSSSIWMSFEIDKEPDMIISARCPEGTIYDARKSRCVEARCSLLRHLHNNACERTIEEVEGYSYRIAFRLKPTSAVDIDTAITVVPELGNILHTLLSSVFGSITKGLFEITITADIEFHDDLRISEVLTAKLLWFEVHLKLSNTEFHDPEEKLETMLSNVNQKTVYIEIKTIRIELLILLRDSLHHFSEEKAPYPELQCSYALTYFSLCGNESLESLKVYRVGNLATIPYPGRVHVEYHQFYLQPISSERNILEFRTSPFVKVLKSDTFWSETDNGLEFPNQNRNLNSVNFTYGDSADVIWVLLEEYNVLFDSGNSLPRSKCVVICSYFLASFLIMTIE